MALAVLDSLEFDPLRGGVGSVAQVGPGVYVIAYYGGAEPWAGRLITVSIDAEGNIGESVIDELNFGAGEGQGAFIIHVSGTMYAVVYTGASGTAGDDGWLVTVNIDTAGDIADAVTDSHRFSTNSSDPEIIHISGTIYAIVYNVYTTHGGRVTTINIADGGTIGAVEDSLSFGVGTMGISPNIVHVTGDIYAIVYKGGEIGVGATSELETVDIDSEGNIAAVDSLQLEAAQAGRWESHPSIVHVSGSVYAIAYEGLDIDGYLKTVTIDALGSIGGVIETLEFDESRCMYPHIIQLSDDSYAIAYPGVASDGWLKIISMGADGTNLSVEQSLEYDTRNGTSPYVIRLTASTVAIAYSGYGSDGWLRTVGEVEAPTVTTDPATGLAQPMVATFNGALDDDGGMACECGFEYGETEAYGTTTPTESKNTGETFSQAITGLSPGTVYHFRAIAENGAGTSYGSDRIFRTRGQYQGNPHIDQLIYQHVERMGR